MSLTSLQYVALIAVVCAAVWLLRRPGHQKIALVAASMFFYWTRDPRATVVLLGLAATAYVLGVAIERVPGAPLRRGLLVGGVTLALGVLGAFKYFDFFIGSIRAESVRSTDSTPVLALFVVAGVSFIVFQTISYLVDVYRGDERARHPADILLLVSFFPHLIAGPLLRSRDFLAQFDSRIEIRAVMVERGLVRYIVGVVEKVLIADRLGMFVDTVYASPGAWSSLTVWLAALAYALQILFDFVGYSNMAIGSAACLGVTLPENFRRPYFAVSITDFWRRWHITLSHWLRDYLYIPLGGNRRGPVRQGVNLVAVMTLGGLWHGAGWPFVLWGLAHGLGLVVHKGYSSLLGDRIADARRESRSYRLVSWALTFLFVTLTWVLFRAESLQGALGIYSAMFGLASAGPVMAWVPTSLVTIASLIAAYQLLRVRGFDPLELRLVSLPGSLLLGFTIGALLLLAPAQPTPFVYAGF